MGEQFTLLAHASAFYPSFHDSAGSYILKERSTILTACLVVPLHAMDEVNQRLVHVVVRGQPEACEASLQAHA